MIHIGKPRLINMSDGHVRLVAKVVDEAQNIDDELWYETTPEFGAFFCDEIGDAFLVALLLPAIRFHEDIQIDAPISEKLYFNITHRVTYHLSCAWNGIDYASKNQISVKCMGTTIQDFNPKAVGTGCSLGVDSFAVLAQHLSDECPCSFRISHLTLFNAGAYGSCRSQECVLSYNRDFARVSAFAKVVGLPLVAVDSNIHQFYNKRGMRFNFNQSHTLRNMSIVLALQKLFRKYLYASAVTIGDYALQPSCSATNMESMILSDLSTDNVDLISADADKTRSKKTMLIADNQLAQKYLNVCLREQIINNRHDTFAQSVDSTKQNCGRCEKCLRTLLTLDLLGKLENFREVFDIDYYERVKDRYLGVVYGLRHESAINADIIKLAYEGRGVPIHSKIIALLPKSKLKYMGSHMYEFVK